MKANFPAERPNPAVTFVHASLLLLGNSAGMRGAHTKLKGNGLRFHSLYFLVFCILPSFNTSVFLLDEFTGGC